jgi:hypothetical protein
MYTFHTDKTHPHDKGIFVFGSNLAGFHGAGAALSAKLLYGATLGMGIGLMGRCYAIPTKDRHIRTLNLSVITQHVDVFKTFTHDNPEMRFFVTRVGCGLAGYTDKVIAPLFRTCNVNCSFAEAWQPYLE